MMHRANLCMYRSRKMFKDLKSPAPLAQGFCMWIDMYIMQGVLHIIHASDENREPCFVIYDTVYEGAVKIDKDGGGIY